MQDWLIVAFAATMAAILPEVALGASIGSLFYLLSHQTETGYRKVILMIVGWVVGYSIGQALHEGGWALFAATLGSAFAVSIMIQISIALNSVEMPPVVDWLADLYLKIRR